MPNPHGTPANLKPRRKGQPSPNQAGINQYTKPGSTYRLLQDVIHQIEAEEVDTPKGKRTVIECGVRAVASKWLQGDMVAADWMGKYGHGRPKESFDLFLQILNIFGISPQQVEDIKTAVEGTRDAGTLPPKAL